MLIQLSKIFFCILLRNQSAPGIDFFRNFLAVCSFTKGNNALIANVIRILRHRRGQRPINDRLHAGTDPIINNLTESQTMGVSGEPPAPYGRYQNIFLSQTEYDELQAEYPDRLERFIEEMSRYLAANGKSYQNYAAALRIWAGNDKKKAPKKGIPDYSCKEGESL